MNIEDYMAEVIGARIARHTSGRYWVRFDEAGPWHRYIYVDTDDWAVALRCDGREDCHHHSDFTEDPDEKCAVCAAGERLQ